MQLVAKLQEGNPVSLRFAILASLESSPQTGYEIAREFDSGVGNFWHATHQQIYRELSKLAQESLVQFEQIQQDSRPSKKRYRITQLGQDALASWLNSPTSRQPVRDPLLVKISAGFLADREKLRAEVLDQRDIYQRQLQRFEGYEKEFHGCKTPPTEKQMYLYMTLRRGIIASEGWIAWANEVLVSLDSLEKTS